MGKIEPMGGPPLHFACACTISLFFFSIFFLFCPSDPGPSFESKTTGIDRKTAEIEPMQVLPRYVPIFLFSPFFSYFSFSSFFPHSQDHPSDSVMQANKAQTGENLPVCVGPPLPSSWCVPPFPLFFLLFFSLGSVL